MPAGWHGVCGSLPQAGQMTVRRHLASLLRMCKPEEPDATVYSLTEHEHSQGASMSRFTRNAAVITLGIATLASLPAIAADALNYNQISLRAEVSQEVARDKMIVTLYTESQNSDPAKLAAEITSTMNKALGQTREVKGVTLRQGSRNSYPIYDSKNQKITGWR